MSFTVYKSSAGSGKTFTLVKEYLKIALGSDQRDKYREILAMTFTNKAANEMKERVLSSLKDFTAGKPLNGTSGHLLTALTKELKAEEDQIRERAGMVLEHIIHHYADFSISTIDKFVHKIIRTFARDLHIPFNFEVEMDTEALLKNAIDRLLAKVGSDEELTKTLVAFTERKTDDEQSWHIEKDILNFAWHILREDGQMHLDRLRNVTIADFSGIRNQLRSALIQFESQIQSIAGDAWQAIRDAGLEHAAFYRGSSGISKYFEKLIAGKQGIVQPNSYVLITISEDKWFSGKATDVDKENINAIKGQLAEAFHKIIEIMEKGWQEYTLFKLIYRNIYALAVLNEIEKILEELKQENQILPISEFNKRISEIVMHEPAPFIYERIGEKYRHYLIDEFQDTSVLQWHNLLPLVDNSLASGNFNMVVGDGKQAIYRWRSGEVEQLAKLPELINPENNEFIKERESTLKRNHEEKSLGKNFRSKAEIVQFNNFFFTELALKLAPEYRHIYKELEQDYNRDNTGGFVSVEAVQKNDEKSLVEIVLSKTAAIIQTLLDDGYELKDIAILCRSNNEASQVATFLLEKEIDVVSSESLLLSSSPKVRFIVSVLSFLSNKHDTVAQTEIILYLSKKQAIQTNLHETITAINDAQTSFSITKLLKKHSFGFNPSKLVQLPLYEAVEEVIRIFNLNNNPDPFIAFFLEFIQHYHAKQDKGLNGFLEWWDSKKDKQSIVLPEGTDAINVMTIHKAKGLEFPAVILPFADWNISNTRKQLWLDTGNAGIPKLKSVLLPTISELENTTYSEEYLREKHKSLLDNFNMLYVAFTRPSERLYVLTSPPGSGNRMSNHYFEILKNSGNWNKEKMQYLLGEPSPKDSAKKAKTDGKTERLKQMVSQSWRGRIALSLKAPDYWDFESNDKQSMPRQEYGKLLHKALSAIYTIDDIDGSLNKMLLQGDISPSELKELKEKLQTLLENEQVKPFFEKGAKVKNEAEIILPDGNAYRPDRVVINGNDAAVVDYKTGAPREAHQKQLKQYAETLENMGYDKVDRYLIYTETIKVEQV